LKRDPVVEKLDLGDDLLNRTVEDYVSRDKSAAIDVDDFLAYLREKEVIDSSEYVRAAANAPIHADTEEQAPPDERRRYRILGPIGMGGMAEVRVAHDEVLHRNVAIKILHPHRRENPSVIRRFIQEAKITGRLDHPNIVPVHGLHIDQDGEVSFTMKLVHGRTLKELLDDVERTAAAGKPLEEQLSLRGRLEAFSRVCEAVHYAHDRGVVHRDLKPANIMIGHHGEIYVMDWGIAKLIGEPDEVAAMQEEMGLDEELMIARTSHGTIVGTPAYMSPEQAIAAPIDGRSDVYALGAILYELVSLKRMVAGETGTDVLSNVVHGHREPLPGTVPGSHVDDELAAIIDKATAPVPDDRYPTARALGVDLRRYLADEETEARPDNWLRGLLRWIGRNRQISLVVFLAVTSGFALVAAYSFWQRNRTLARSQASERASNALVSHTAERAHAIDAQFVLFENAASTLARDARLALQGRLSADLPPHRSASFDEGNAPPSAVQSKAYDKLIALDRPGYKLPPGSSPDDLEDRVRALGALASTYHHIFASVGTAPESMSLFEWIAERGAPIKWSYVGTDDGIMVSYPAKGGYPPEYDPRERPWYRLGDGQSDVVWGNVYIDLQGQGMVLPAVTEIGDGTGGSHGVAGIETTFDWVIEEFMTAEPPVTEAYLLDDVGRVVMKSSDLGREYGEGDLHNAADLPVFEVPEVVERMQKRHSGLVRTRQDRRDVLISFQRIPTIGWYYVERAPLQDLLSNPRF
jgi:serine/threonine-protein kinase